MNWSTQALKPTPYTCDLADRISIKACGCRNPDPQWPGRHPDQQCGRCFRETVLLDLDDKEIERTFDINALALFWTVRAFLPLMLEHDSGHIVTIASAAGLVGTGQAHRLLRPASTLPSASTSHSVLNSATRAATSKPRSCARFFIDTGMFDGATTRISFLLPILKPGPRGSTHHQSHSQEQAASPDAPVSLHRFSRCALFADSLV